MINFRLTFTNSTNDDDIFEFINSDQLNEFLADESKVKQFKSFAINSKEVLFCDFRPYHRQEFTGTVADIVAAIDQ